MNSYCLSSGGAFFISFISILISSPKDLIRNIVYHNYRFWLLN